MRWLLLLWALVVLSAVACGTDGDPSLPAAPDGFLLPDGPSVDRVPAFWDSATPNLAPGAGADGGVAPPPPAPDAHPPTPPDSGPPPSLCRPNESQFNGHCYLAVGYKWMDHAAAAQLCAANQAAMAVISTAAENQFVYSLLPALNQAAWIGLKRSNAGFAWADGSALTFANWAPGEPNNSDGTENCVVMWGPHLSITGWRGQWNDVPCGAPGRDTVVCKRKP